VSALAGAVEPSFRLRQGFGGPAEAHDIIVCSEGGQSPLIGSNLSYYRIQNEVVILVFIIETDKTETDEWAHKDTHSARMKG
jgi:hypothetical protein